MKIARGTNTHIDTEDGLEDVSNSSSGHPVYPREVSGTRSDARTEVTAGMRGMP